MISTPKILRRVYKNAIWSVEQFPDQIYLSYDDGPHPETTIELLELLDEYEAKAHFFLIGKNAERYPDLFSEYQKRGHLVGNHSYSHLNGLKASKTDYLKDIEQCNSIFQSPFFRPPYGRMNPSFCQEIEQKYQIVMWDVLSMDFKLKSAKACFQNIKKRTKGGSIILMHENDKSKNIVLELTKMTLDYCAEKKWKCSLLKSNKPLL